MASQAALPEVRAVAWRRPADEHELRRAERLWHLTTLAHTVPFLLTAALLLAVEPLTAPVALASAAHAWIIPGLYARRGANVALPVVRSSHEAAELRAAGFLGDLVGHEARALHARTGLVMERGRMGVWLVGERGALLLRPGGRVIHCWCVRVAEPSLPAADRIAHLLLALRSDEVGFATVANRAFAGTAWRIGRRLPRAQRPALAAARAAAAA